MNNWCIFRDGRWWVFAPAGAAVEGGWTCDVAHASLMTEDEAARWSRRVGGEPIEIEPETL